MQEHELRAYALEGARAQLARIYAAFPQLREGGTGAPAPAIRKRHSMPLAQRKAIAARMRAWHKARRIAAGKAAKGAGR